MKLTGLAAVIGVLLLTGRSASAHHGYAAFVTENRVTIEGDLQELRWANPHVIMTIRTADSTVTECLAQERLQTLGARGD